MKNNISKYCESLFYRKRLKTKKVKVGNVIIGGLEPIVIQSMINTSTLDTASSVNQITKLVDNGCQIVRLTVQNIKEVNNLEKIKNKLIKKNYNIPLVADVHFQPSLAFEVCKYVEKIRINPGNFCEKVNFKKIEYSESKNKDALKYIEDEFGKLLSIVKKRNIAIRIGINHGSLSERIMKKYGNTIPCMVESAIEYLKIALKNHFHNIVFSMKSSNPKIMIEAYRILVDRMIKMGNVYPLHIGVTEAGSGVEGRIKSAVGIGSLLADGLGDTIRVSLTENPVNEVPIAKALMEVYNKNFTQNNKDLLFDEFAKIIDRNDQKHFMFMNLKKETTNIIKIDNLYIGSNQPVRIELSYLGIKNELNNLDYFKKNNADMPIELLEMDLTDLNKKTLENLIKINIPKSININSEKDVKKFSKYADKFSIDVNNDKHLDKIKEIVNVCERKNKAIQINFNCNYEKWLQLTNNILSDITYDKVIIGLITDDLIHNYRKLYKLIETKKLKLPISLIIKYLATENLVAPKKLLRISSELGSLLSDGLGNIISVKAFDNMEYTIKVIYGILQATGVRICKAEYISCPSCGRTSFNIEKIAEVIKSKTSHLKGIKIAIMGCVVNGLGEMGDADYGYIGSSKGKVNLYKGKKCVKKHIKEKDAINEFMEVIKEGQNPLNLSMKD